MKTLQNTVEKIDNFLYNLYINEETSKTELVNFLNDYIYYILLKNSIQPENYCINLHFIKTFGDCVTDFKYKTQKNKKKKLRNKENIKKKRNTENAQTLAFIDFDKDIKNINIYLNIKLCDIKCLYDISNLSMIISQLGHEVAHLVQQIKCLDNFIICEKTYKQIYLHSLILNVNGFISVWYT